MRRLGPYQRNCRITICSKYFPCKYGWMPRLIVFFYSSWRVKIYKQLFSQTLWAFSAHTRIDISGVTDIVLLIPWWGQHLYFYLNSGRRVFMRTMLAVENFIKERKAFFCCHCFMWPLISVKSSRKYTSLKLNPRAFLYPKTLLYLFRLSLDGNEAPN